MTDASRLEWVREKTCNGLGVDAALFDQHLTGEAAVALITKFLDEGTCSKSLCALGMSAPCGVRHGCDGLSCRRLCIAGHA